MSDDNHTHDFYNQQRLKFFGLFVTSMMFYCGGALIALLGLYGQALLLVEGPEGLSAFIDPAALFQAIKCFSAASLTVILASGSAALAVALNESDLEYKTWRGTAWVHYPAYALSIGSFILATLGTVAALSSSQWPA